jgi:hypothetical protein
MQKILFFLYLPILVLSPVCAEDNNFNWTAHDNYLAAHQKDTAVWWLDDFHPNDTEPATWARMAGTQKKISRSFTAYRSSLLITMTRETIFLTNRPPHFGYSFGDSIYFEKDEDSTNQKSFSIGFISAKQGNGLSFVTYQAKEKRLLILAQECPSQILSGLIFRELNYSLANNDQSAAVNFRLANVFAGNIINQETSGDFFQYLDKLLATKSSADPLRSISATELLRIDQIIGAKNIGPTLARELLEIYYGAASSRLMMLRMKTKD